MTQHRSQPNQFNGSQSHQPYQAQVQAQIPGSDLPQNSAQAPTFHQPVNHVRQQMQMQRSADSNIPIYGAYAAPIQPGGQGPLAGFESAQPHVTDGYQENAPINQEAYPADSMATDTPPVHSATLTSPMHTQVSQQLGQFQHPPQRPSFPAAPSKVLAEQYAKGGDGHIRHGGQAPAFETPPITTTPMLEGVYPDPQTITPPKSTAAPFAGGEAGASPRPSPRLQHIDPALQAKLSGLGEPNFSEAPSTQIRTETAKESAFWAFSAGVAEPNQNRRSPVLISVFFTVIMLIGLLAYGSWSQFRNGQTVSAPIRITAQAGPERIIPEDPGGLRIENQDLGVLNPDVINPVILDLRPEAAVVIEEILDPELIDPASIAPTVAATANSVDQNIDIQVNIAATPEVAVAAAAAVSAPGAIPGEETPPQTAEASQPALVPTPRPQTIPVREALARGSAVAGASSVATGSDPDLITVAPRELHVQEGSYVSLQSAKASYASLQQRAGSRLSGITAQYHRVQVDGRTWYRLYLVGFSDLSAAAALGGTLGRDSRNWLIRNA